MQTLALLQLGLQLLPMVQTGVTEFIAWLHTLRSTLKQTGEWTAEQDQVFMAALWAKTADPAYLLAPSSSSNPVTPGS